MNEYVLILGANMPSKFGDILTTLQMCVEYIKNEEPIDLISQSKWYQSESFPDKSKPTFINVGIKIISKLEPYQILKIIDEIEKGFGRIRKRRWDARVCDIDIIYCNKKIIPTRNILKKWMSMKIEEQLITTPRTLILPHPRIQDRLFFLVPLNELSPNWRHPILGKTAKEILDSIPQNEIDVLEVI